MYQSSEEINRTRLQYFGWLVFYWDCHWPGSELNFASALEGLSVGGRQLLRFRDTRDDGCDYVDNSFFTFVGLERISCTPGYPWDGE